MPQNTKKIQYNRTPADALAELNVVNGDPDVPVALGELVVGEQVTAPEAMSLDPGFAYTRSPDDAYAERYTEWLERDEKLRDEASMRVAASTGLVPGQTGEPEAYERELTSLRELFGSPKPTRPEVVQRQS